MALYQTGTIPVTSNWTDVIGDTIFQNSQFFNSTEFVIVDAGANNFTEVVGTGFTYNSNTTPTAVTGGTITGLGRSIGGGSDVAEQISGIFLNAATFWADTPSQKFAAALNGTDTFELTQTQLSSSGGDYAINGYGGGGLKTVSETGLTSDSLDFLNDGAVEQLLDETTQITIPLTNINGFTGGSGTNTADYSGLTTSGLFAIIQGGGGTVNKGDANGSDTLASVQTLIDNGTGRSNGDVFELDSAENITASSSNFNYLIELSAGVDLAYGTNFTGITEFVSNVGVNTVDFSADASFAYLFGSVGNDTLTLGSGGGYLFGEGGTNVLTGSANATNLFVGGDGGTDTMNGGTGGASNFYFVDGNDQVNGAGAFNTVIELVSGVTVQLGSTQYHDVQEFVADGGANVVTVASGDNDFVYLYGGTGNDTLTTGSGGGYLFGEGGTNVLTGGGGLNVFVADGGAGADTMNGGSSSNIYYIDANSTVDGAGTFNTVIELQQNATLTLGSAQLGTDVQQVIFNGGTNSADFHTATSAVFLYGGSGSDTLFGGIGNDFLFGGTGSNTFKFGTGWGQDTIEDWTAGTNSIIDLTGLSSLGVHATTDLTQTLTGGNDVITSSHTGTNSITLLGVGAALTAGSFHFA